MSDYRAVSEALAAGVDPAMLCLTCPWDRFCLTPPTKTRAEVDAEIEKARREDEARPERDVAAGKNPGMPVGLLITSLAVGGRDTSASICPVFALRLRSSGGQQIVGTIRAAMQGVATEETP